MNSCGCGSTATNTNNTDASAVREMVVDLFYIDIDTCDRCQGARGALREAVDAVAQPLAAMGVTVRLTETLVQSAEQAEAVALYSSPSIRIDGVDIQPAVHETTCNACSSLPNQASVDCREWTYQGEQFTSPPKGLIVKALMDAALSPPAPPPRYDDYVMPANLRAFFANKAQAKPAATPTGEV